MGLGLSFSEGKVRGSPDRCARRPISSALSVPDPEIELRYVIDAVRLIRRELAGRSR